MSPFDRQPFALTARLTEVKPQLAVEPSYTVTVEADRLTLDATFSYSLRGSRLDLVKIEPAGWRVM